jgi:phage terminase large subunit GpA-like protein
MNDLAEYLKKALVPEQIHSPVEWSRHLYFSERISPGFPGPFDVSLTPYLEEPINNYANRTVKVQALCTATQVGKSTAISVGTAYRVKHMPTNIVWVWDNATNAGSFSKRVWKPMLLDCGQFTDELPHNMRDYFGNAEQHFSRCVVNFVGSNSPGNLAGRPAGVLNLDEVDKYPTETKGEGSAVQLAIERTTNVPGAFVSMASSPTTEEGMIWRHYQMGDQRVFEMPSPHDPHKYLHFEFNRDNLIWSPDARDEDGRWILDDVMKTTHYVCPFTKKPITDAHKSWMMRRGRWKAQNTKAESGHLSYHLPKFYSPTMMLGRISREFLYSRDLFGLRNFYNSWLALPWQERGSRVRDSDVLTRRGSYQRGTIPMVPKIIMGGADVGLDYVKWVVAAFSEYGEPVVIDWGQEIGPEQTLSMMVDRKYRCGITGADHDVAMSWMDAKYRKDDVHRVCYSSNGFLWPTSGGSGGVDRRNTNMGSVPPYPAPYGMLSYTDNDFKHLMYIQMIKENRFPGIRFPQNMDGDFVNEFTNEELVTDPHAPAVRAAVWKRKGPNHWADALKVCLAGFKYLCDQGEIQLQIPDMATAAATREDG